MHDNYPYHASVALTDHDTAAVTGRIATATEPPPATAGLKRTVSRLPRPRTGATTDQDIVRAVLTLPLPDTAPDARYTPAGLTAAWLAQFASDHTRRAYFRDLADWLAWCAAADLDPLAVRRADVDTYTRRLATRTNPPPAKSTVARRLSAVSSWYSYLIDNEAATVNPVKAVKRPKVDHDTSSTAWLTIGQAREFLAAARADATRQAQRNVAMLGMLLDLGLRVGELLRADVADVRHNAGHRTLTVRGKGNRRRELPIPAAVGRDLDAYLEDRAGRAGVTVAGLAGPLFATSTGARLTQPYLFRLVRRTARAAGIPQAAALSPHSLRHTAATAALERGATLPDVQDYLGHADPRTTRRYDRSRCALDRSPVHLLGTLFAN
jgi:site-specific recombinase XerD